jgi:adenylylsulfate kinase
LRPTKIRNARRMAMYSNSTHKRSWVKALTWRIISVLTTALTVYCFTDEIKTIIGVTVIANVVLTILYYFHERAWKLTKWGKYE